MLVPFLKPHDPVMDIYESQYFYLKTWIYIWMSMDVVSLEYVTLTQMFHYITCLFLSITVILLVYNGLQWYTVALLVLIGIYTLLRLHIFFYRFSQVVC